MTRTRLLAIAATPLWPMTNGFSLRVTSLLRELVKHWEIALVAPPPVPQGSTGLPLPLEYCPVSLDGSWASEPSPQDAHTLREAVRRTVSRFRPEVALVWSGAEFLTFSREMLPVTVGDRIDCMSLIHWREARTQSGLMPRLRSIREALRYMRYERRAVRSSAATVVVGQDDAAALRRISGCGRIHVVPNGVALQAPAGAEVEASEPTVVFSGVMAYRPNVQAVEYFAESVWPRVRERVPNARFVIAGRDPLPEVLALGARSGIEVLPNVPDMRAVLRESWVAVAPMRSGSGIKNKVLEAWALGRPVVMSQLAANGLRLDEDAHDLVANDAVEMADQVVRLLEQPLLRHRMGRSGHGLAQREHGWADAADRVSRLLEEARATQGPVRHF